MGSVLLAALVAGTVVSVFRGILRVSEGDRRSLLAGCAGALTVMLLHSFVDFNMHIPANAMTFAWIAAVASMNASAGFAAMTPRPAHCRHPVSLHDQIKKDQKSAVAGMLNRFNV